MLEQSDINSNVIFFDVETPIHVIVEAMVEKKVSSILITEGSSDNEKVVGIVTERDIVRKFTLLDMADKMERKVAAIMTRPVAFAELKTFKEDVIRLHLDKTIRHFPILKGNDPLKKNIVGILSITDILRAMVIEKTPKIESIKTKTLFGPLFLMAKQPSDMEIYRHIFCELGYGTTFISSLDAFLRSHLMAKPPLLVDLDYYTQKELQPLLPAIHVYPGPLVLTSSNLGLIGSLRKFQKKDANRLIAAKPLDFSYVHWLLSTKWLIDLPEVKEV